MIRAFPFDHLFACQCGHIEKYPESVSAAEIAVAAAKHAESHRSFGPEEHRNGCGACDCRAIYEPVVSTEIRCDCGHSVGRHDQFCCVVSCGNILEHAPFTIVNGPAIYLLCEEHSLAARWQ